MPTLKVAYVDTETTGHLRFGASLERVTLPRSSNRLVGTKQVPDFSGTWFW